MNLTTIKRAFELALGRAAGKEEVELCVERWNIATRSESQKKPVAPSFPKKIKRTVMAEKTGEPYDFGKFFRLSNLINPIFSTVTRMHALGDLLMFVLFSLIRMNSPI